MHEVLKDVLCCPYCSANLKRMKLYYVCTNCGDKYDINSDTGQIDLRLKRPKEIVIKQTIANSLNAFYQEINSGVYGFQFGYQRNPNGIDFSSISKDKRKPVDKLYSWLPHSGGIAIDIGSAKDKRNKAYLEKAGFAYVSVDYDSPDAMILADAHSLPFKDNSVNCLTNLAVMEHIEFPYIAGREFFRVLKQGGRMLGVVHFYSNIICRHGSILRIMGFIPG